MTLENVKVSKLFEFPVTITCYLRECSILRILLMLLRIIEPSLDWRLFQQLVRTFGSKSFYQYISEVRCSFIATSASLLCTIFCSESFDVCTVLYSNLSSQFSLWNIKIKGLWLVLQPAGTLFIPSLPNLFWLNITEFVFLSGNSIFNLCILKLLVE